MLYRHSHRTALLLLAAGVTPSSRAFITSTMRFASFRVASTTRHARCSRTQRRMMMTTTTGSPNDDNDNDIMIPLASSRPNPATDWDWNDRIGLQARYSLAQKGWQVAVEWRQTPYGAGLFYSGRERNSSSDSDSSNKNDILPAGTVLRRGRLGINLKQFTSVQDIDDFCRPLSSSNDNDCEQQQQDASLAYYQARRDYVKDYLWGFDPHADERGYSRSTATAVGEDDHRFFGMWIPGNGLNHNLEPNTVYRPVYNNDNDNNNKLTSMIGIDLVALRDIRPHQELTDDYRRHGTAPTWLKEFAKEQNVTLNFADCNDFVEKEEEDQ